MVKRGMGLFAFSNHDRQEKRRLEAFMDALPLEYCGWNDKGAVVWSRGFPKLFALASIRTIRDVQDAIMPSDAAALEGMIWQLQKHDEAFSLTVKTAENHKTLTLHGMKGRDLDGYDTYDVIWVEDSSEKQNGWDDLNDDLDKLRHDIEQYRIVLDLLPQAIWVIDEEQKLIWCNTAYAAIIGRDRDDAIGAPLSLKAILLDRDGEKKADPASLHECAEKSLNSHEPVTTRGRLIIDGKRRLTDIAMIPHKRENFVVGVAQDITEREELRSELKRYVAANAELMEQLSTAIAIFSASQNLEFYNNAFSLLWGLEEQWLNTRPALADILEKLREMRRLPEQADFRAYKKNWLDMFTTLLSQHQDMLYLPDGKAIRVMIAPHPMGGLMMTFEDVTSRLELESSYNTLIAVQRETLDSLGEGVVVYGSDGRLKLYNPSYLKLWDLNPEDVDGEPHVSVIVEKKKKFFKGKAYDWADIKARLTAHAIERTESRQVLMRSDGVCIECTGVPLPDGGMMATYRDITDAQRVQQALREKNQALEEAEKLKTDFLANVSYQLRTPLNAISGFAEILTNQYFGEINTKQAEYTQGITDAANRLASLIDDILDLSSIEAGYLRLDRNSVDSLEFLENIYELTRDWAGMETLQIIFDKPGKSPGQIMADERRLKQALMNILRNAINFTPGGGKITLALTQQGNDIVITVKDTGIGIAEDDQERLFEPFRSFSNGDEAKENAPNASGLGLSLAKNIITLHGGRIVIDSVMGEGTTVTISLPQSL